MTLVVILLPGTTLGDWRAWAGPNLRQLMGAGAMALMNTRTARMPTDHEREPPDAAVLTLAAGARASAASGAGEFTDLSSPGTPGLSSADAPAHVNDWFDPNWSRERRANFGQGYDIELGNLQEALWNVHHPMVVERDSLPQGLMSSIVAGAPSEDSEASPLNAETQPVNPPAPGDVQTDLPNGGFRCGLLFASDSHGGALAGGVMPTADQTDPGGCWVLDLGPDVAAADSGIGQAMTFAQESHGRLLIISPYVNDRAYARDDRLAPVLLWGDAVPHGLLSSLTTRRPGLITNLDIAPTIAAYYGAALPTAGFGAPVTVTPSSGDTLQRLIQLRGAALAQRQGQAALPYCALFIGLCLLVQGVPACAASACAKRTTLPCAHPPREGGGGGRSQRDGPEPAPVWLQVCAALPVAIVCSLEAHDAIHAEVVFLLVAGMFALAVIRRGLPVALPVACAVLAALITSAAATGRFHGDDSLLGYSPIEGARYYGIGNEAMGVLLGAALAACGYWWERTGRGRVFLMAAMAATICVVGWPTLGAKAGGVIVFAGAFGVFIRSASGRSFDARAAAFSAIAGMALLAAFALLDAHHAAGARSHLGRAVARIASGGVRQAADIIGRKLAVELKLATHSTWAVPVWAGLFCLIQQRRNPSLPASARALADAGLVGSILALLFNDAGAVACSLSLALVCASLTSVEPLPIAAATVDEEVQSPSRG